MKHFLLAALAAVMLMCASAAASVANNNKSQPAQHPTPIYKCRATSDYAWGIGFGPTRRRAAVVALRHCSRHTPSSETCVLDWCRRLR